MASEAISAPGVSVHRARRARQLAAQPGPDRFEVRRCARVGRGGAAPRQGGQRRKRLGAPHRRPADDRHARQPHRLPIGVGGALPLAPLAALERVVEDGGQGGRQHHLFRREGGRGPPLQDQHSRGRAGPKHRHRQQRGELLLAEARDVLEAGVAIGVGDRDRTQPVGGEAGDPLAAAEVDATERLGRKTDVAPHREPLAVRGLFAHVDAGHVGAGDGRDVAAHGGQHVLQRLLALTERDQPEDSIQRRVVAAVMNLVATVLRGCHLSPRFLG